MLTIDLVQGSDTQGQNTLTVTDLLGRTMMRQSFGGTTHTLHLNGLSTGIYLLTVVNASGEWLGQMKLQKE